MELRRRRERMDEYEAWAEWVADAPEKFVPLLVGPEAAGRRAFRTIWHIIW